MKFNLNKIWILVVGFVLVSNTVFAADVLKCDTELPVFYDSETTKFLQFLDDHFKNKSSDSTLMNTAIARYNAYKQTLSVKYAEYQPNDVKATQDEVYKKLLTCQDMTQSYIDLAKNKLTQRILDANAQKKATAIVEKYKAINKGLAGMSSDVANLFGYFKTFENKLPGYLGNKCMVKLF